MEVESKTLASNIELQKAVQNIFTKEFNAFLIKYSIIRINNRFDIKYDLNKGFRGIMVEDMISDVMLSFLKEDGGRNWYKKKFPDFKDQVISALDSHISNTIGKEFDKTFRTDYNEEDTIDLRTEEDNYEELIQMLIDILIELGASDEEILLFEPYVVHGMKRADVAREFGISDQEATNIKKKIDRRIPLLREAIKKLKS